MMLGLGQAAGPVSTTDPGFVAGMESWTSPGSAIAAVPTLFSNLGAMFTNEPMYTMGFLATPIMVLTIAASLFGGRR